MSLRAPRYVRPVSDGTTQRVGRGAVPVAPGVAGVFVPAGGGGGAGATLKFDEVELTLDPAADPKR
jgi:hypothetical protein